jgi:hypothetical protein
MPVNLHSRANQLGIVSLSLSVLFRIYFSSGFGSNAFTDNHYVEFVLLPGVLVLATITAVVAALRGTKWWLLALLGPLAGAILLLSWYIIGGRI